MDYFGKWKWKSWDFQNVFFIWTLKSFFLLNDLLGNILSCIYQKKNILFLLLKKKELPYFNDEKTALVLSKCI